MQKLLIVFFVIVLLAYGDSQFSVTFRDFNLLHEDFQYYVTGAKEGLASSQLNENGCPDYAGDSSTQSSIHTQTSFSSWYRDIPTLNIRYDINVTFTTSSSGSLVYAPSQTHFFPLNGKGWNTSNPSEEGSNNNLFTTHISGTFTYKGGENYEYGCDDDCWVYIDSKLVLDLGGTHTYQAKTLNYDTLNITIGETYTFDFFHAERHTTYSGIKIEVSPTFQNTQTNYSCFSDQDKDGIPDCQDNCVTVYNPDQADCNQNYIGDACDQQQGNVQFPYVASAQMNFNSSYQSGVDNYTFGQSNNFTQLTSSQPISYQFNDPLPESCNPDFSVEVQIAFINNGMENCDIQVQFTSSLGSSQVQTAIIPPGESGCARQFDQIEFFYNFAYSPIGGNGTSLDTTLYDTNYPTESSYETALPSSSYETIPSSSYETSTPSSSYQTYSAPSSSSYSTSMPSSSYSSSASGSSSYSTSMPSSSSSYQTSSASGSSSYSTSIPSSSSSGSSDYSSSMPSSSSSSSTHSSVSGSTVSLPTIVHTIPSSPPASSGLPNKREVSLGYENYYHKRDMTGAGVNTITISSLSPSCDGNLLTGSVIVNFRYSLENDTNKNTGYYNSCISNFTCEYGTYRFGGYCACWSGAFGRQCTMGNALPGTSVFPNPESVITDAWSATVPEIQDMYFHLDYNLMAGRSFYRNFTNHPTCPDLNNWEKVQDLSTGGVVSLDSASFSDIGLKIQVSQPFVDGRADGALFLNADDEEIVPLIDCYYPRSAYINKSVDVCRDIWTFQIPWSSAKNCLWNISDDQSYTTYKGQVIVQNLEWIGLEQWRIIRSVLRIKIRFQEFIEIQSSSEQIYNQNVEIFGVTKQIVSLQLGQPALVEVGTLLQWPYKLYNFTMGLFPLNKIAGVSYSNKDCNSTQGEPCRQYWDTLLSLTTGTCSLDGTYALNFTVGCGVDVQPSNCPLSKPSDFIASVVYTLTSENFCAEVDIDVGITGEIYSYLDANFVAHQSSFILDRTAYYLIIVNSDLNGGDNETVVTFTGIDITNIALQFSNGTLVRVWQNGNSTNLGGSDCQLISSYENGTALPGDEMGFSLVFTDSLVYIPASQEISVNVVVDIQVNYNGGSPSQNYEQSKRASSEGKDPNTVAITTSLQGTGFSAAPSTSSNSPTSSKAPHENNGSFTLLVSLIMLALIFII